MSKIRTIALIPALLAYTAVSTAGAIGAQPTTHARQQFHAFCKDGVPSKAELERRVAKSLRDHPDGLTPIEGCRTNPLQLMQGLKEGDDPGKGPQSLDQLVPYLQKLVQMTPDHEVRYWSSCLRGKSSGIEDIIMRCEPQTIPENVPVYGNPETGRMTLKLDCVNPGLVPVEPSPCALINIPKGAVLAHVAFRDAKDQCAATRAAKPGTRDDGKGWAWFTPCSASVCDFSAFMTYTGWQTTPVGKTSIGALGQQIRVSSSNRTDICFEDADGNVSDTVSVRPEDFKRVGGVPQATVGPEFIRYESRH